MPSLVGVTGVASLVGVPGVAPQVSVTSRVDLA